MNHRAKGIACLGHWIVDRVRIVDRWPREETLAKILDHAFGTGGLAYNVSLNLSMFEMGIPVEGVGLIGDDEDGARILSDCQRHGIDVSNLKTTAQAPTGYTEVISVKSTGKRTFFTMGGANDLIDYDAVPFDSIRAGMVHFGYLLLLKGADAPDPEFGTVGAKILSRFRDQGVRTSVDAVSLDSDQFATIIPPALKFTDYLILNEFEAGRTTGHEILDGERIDALALRESAARLMDHGVSQTVIIHMSHGAYALSRDGSELFQPSLLLPPGYIASTVGAGDAFCSGVLAGIHEGWEIERSVRFGAASAAACLSDPTCCAGMRPAEQVWSLYDQYPLRTEAI